MKRKLGNSDIEVEPLCFGGNVFGWTLDEQKSFKILDAFLDAGFNFIDTADVYSHWVEGHKGGESETILGNWMKTRGNRDRVIIATKLAGKMGPDKKGLSKKYMMEAVEASLKRLQTDYIDLYQAHVDDEQTPLEETLQGFTELLNKKKVKVIGASNYSADRLSEALEISRKKGYARYESLQPCYNLYDRVVYEKELEPACVKNNVGVIPYFSLASGFLTGKYRSEKDLENQARAGYVKKYLNDRGFRILKALDQIAREQNSTPAAVALAWLIARTGITAPIASATSMEQLKSLIAATKLKLDHTSIGLLNEASTETVPAA